VLSRLISANAHRLPANRRASSPNVSTTRQAGCNQRGQQQRPECFIQANY